MHGGVGLNGVPEDQNPCRCNVCSNPRVQDAFAAVDSVSETSRDFFIGALDGIDSRAYTSLLRLSDIQGLEKVKGDSSFPANFMFALAVLLALVIITGIIFLVLTHKGIVHIPGVNSETIGCISRWVEVGLCAASFSYLLLSLGYFMGSKNVDDKKYKAISAINRSNIRKSAVSSREKWDCLENCYSELQEEVSSFKGSVIKSAAVEERELLRLERELDNAETQGSIQTAEYMPVLLERFSLRDMAVAIDFEHAALTEQNRELSQENDRLRTELDGKN